MSWIRIRIYQILLIRIRIRSIRIHITGEYTNLPPVQQGRTPPQWRRGELRPDAGLVGQTGETPWPCHYPPPPDLGNTTNHKERRDN